MESEKENKGTDALIANMYLRINEELEAL